MPRARPSGRHLTASDASLVKGMVSRGDRKHDIAAWFGVNQGRIAEVQSGYLYPEAVEASTTELPPPGPYTSGKAAHSAMLALKEAKKILTETISNIDKTLSEMKAE